MNDITAILLSGGDSSRLWPIRDKNLVKFGDFTLLEHSVSQLQKSGVKNFIIIGNSTNIDYLKRLPKAYSSLNIKTILQKNKKGMAGAILSAKKEIAGKKILVVGPSDVYEDSLISDFEKLIKSSPDGIMTAKPITSYQPLGFIQAEGEIVKGIVEKPPKDKWQSNLASIVFDYFRDGNFLIKAIETVTSGSDGLYEKAKDYLVNQGFVFKLLTYNGYWGYFKYPWHALEISSYFLSLVKKTIKSSHVDESVKITGDVFIDEDVTILENVRITGPVFIGKGTLIGQNCLIRESFIGNGNVIGFTSEITRSLIGNNCWFHHNYIGDSVILDSSAFGSGAVVANFRLDGNTVKSQIAGKKIDSGRTKLGIIAGKSSRFGINCSLMPGVKVGSQSFVGSGVILDHDLPDGKFIHYKNNKTITVSNRHKTDLDKINVNRSKLKI